MGAGSKRAGCGGRADRRRVVMCLEGCVVRAFSKKSSRLTLQLRMFFSPWR